MATPNPITTSTDRAARQLRRGQTRPPPSPPPAPSPASSVAAPNPATDRALRQLRRRQTPPPPSPNNPATASTARVPRKRRRDSTLAPPPRSPASSSASAVANFIENERKFYAAMAAVGPNPGDDLVARGNEILANALVAPKTCNQFRAARMAIKHPEYRRKYAAVVAYIADNPGTDIFDDSLGGIKLARITAVMTQTATTEVKVEGYYLHFAKKLFQPLEDAKRFFGAEKDEITERLQTEKDEITERLQKEKAAPNPDSVSHRKLAVSAAVAAAADAAADAAVQAAFVDKSYFSNPKKLVAAATAVQAAFVNKIECYYLELAKKLFEPLEDAKRAFAMEKDEITERLQKEKAEITERLLKEKDEITERLLKEKDEITERLQKEKDAITERLQKEKGKGTESLHKKKDEVTERSQEKEEIIVSINAEFHYPSKRPRAL